MGSSGSLVICDKIDDFHNVSSGDYWKDVKLLQRLVYVLTLLIYDVHRYGLRIYIIPFIVCTFFYF